MDNSYTENDLEMESFIRIPTAFIDDEFYEKIKDSTEAMVIYGLFDRRLRLSKLNKKNWTDKNGRVYIIYTVDELSKKLKKSKPVIVKAKKILAELGLIVEVRQGLQKPNLIYPQKVRSKKSLLQEVKNIELLGSKKSLLQEVKNIDGSKRDISEKDYIKKYTSENAPNNNNTNIIYSAFEQEFGRLLSPFEIEDVGKMIEENSEELVTEALREAVRQHKPTIKYVNGILNNWKLDNLTTVEQVRQGQKKRTRNRKSDDGFVYDEQYNFEQWGGENE